MITNSVRIIFLAVLFALPACDCNTNFQNSSRFSNTPATLWVPGIPSPRYGATAAYDKKLQRVVLFGGADRAGDIPANDPMWIRNGLSWTTKPSLTFLPAPRTFAAMCLEPTTGNLIMYGGITAEGLIDRDTWIWNGNEESWTRFPATIDGPPALARHSMCVANVGTAVGSTKTRAVIVGGYTDTVNRVVSEQMWHWDEGRWQVAPQSGDTPSCSEHAAAYDNGRGRLVLSGGRRIEDGRLIANDAIFEYERGTWWRRVTGEIPHGQVGTAAVSVTSSSGEHVIIVGGLTDQPRSIQVRWNGAATAPVAELPALARGFYAAAFDEYLSRMVVFGGSTMSHGWLNETWEWDPNTDHWQRWDGATWKYVGRAPLFYSNAILVSDFRGHEQSGEAPRDVLIAYPDGANRLLQWNGSEWVHVASAPWNNYLMQSSACFAAGEMQFIGGTTLSEMMLSLPRWTGNDWRITPKEQLPSGLLPRLGAAVAVDTASDTMIVFGGEQPRPKGKSAYLSDLAIWSDATWHRYDAAAGPTWPQGRHNSMLTYDTKRAAFVLYGGTNDANNSNVLRETWELRLNPWRSQAPRPLPQWTAHAKGQPAPDKALAMTYDPRGSTEACVLLANDGTWTWDGVVWTRRADLNQSIGMPALSGAAIAFDYSEQRLILITAEVAPGNNKTYELQPLRNIQ